MKTWSVKFIENIEISKFVFQSNANSMLSIFSDIENVREVKIKEFENKIETWSKENSIAVREIWNELADEHFDHYNHYKNHINYLVLNSLFISTFSLFENHLNRIAELAYKEFKPAIKITDIKGNGELDTCRKYLNIVCNVKSANSDFREWQEIVHNGSVLNRAEKENLEKIPGYSLVKKYNMWHTPKVVYFRINQVSFLEDFIKLVIGYSENIVHELTH